MAAVWAGRGLADRDRGGAPPRVVLLDGSKTVGVKILVAGGGRCNVTHFEVDEKQYAGGSRNTTKKVLRSFSVPETVEFFNGLGVELKREDTGKLFPVTDRAQTVLNALLGEVRRVGVELVHPWRVGAIEAQPGGGFVVRRKGTGEAGEAIETTRVVLATGGKALPKSGSDGGGYTLATGLGHTLTERLIPALVPLVIGGKSHWMTELSGISARVGVEVRSGTGKRLARFENDMLCTHFGLSGPAVMDASRWLTDAKATNPAASLHVQWLCGETFESVDRALLSLGEKRVLTWVRDRLPERLARALCTRHGVDPTQSGSTLTKDARRALAHALVGMPVEVIQDRGFTHAEATGGGVPLTEIDPGSMRSRVCDGLWLIGEILDVDGRIGGFNFQWAWSSGASAGRAVAKDVIASNADGE
ncbi:MAG: putative Rossmann fold flavoprotein [Phycisphaerales bacterium]|jgi:predicted Rossmann fold flavoprotein